MTAREKNLVLATASATSSLIMLDSNIVAVALPTIARDLSGGFTGIQWVISAYLLTFASLLLPSGSLADLIGRRRTLEIGLVLFLIASAACGFARSLIALDLARAVQGIGGAMLLTSSLAVIASTFVGAERARAYAIWGTALGIAITLGPILGGVITGLAGWRWTFLINLPLCLVYLVAARLFIPETRDPDARRLDVPGMATFALALFALIGALIDGNDLGWADAAIVGRFVLAGAAFAAFIAIEMRTTRPMLDLSLFRSRTLIGAAFGTVGYGTSAQVMIFFLPLSLQGQFHLAPLAAGFAMAPYAVPLFLAPRIVARAVAGWTHRAILVAGLGLAASGNALLGITTEWGNALAIALAMMVAGFATGMLNPETARAFQSQIPPARAGMASGIGGTTRFTSLLIGVAVLGAVYPRFGFPATAAVATALALLNAAAVGALMRERPQTSVELVPVLSAD
jgi:EmrB/QacA subfamily drug resistance transporter